MTYLIVFLILAIAMISWAWVKGIGVMKENHPDYKGEDFLNPHSSNNLANRVEWDDNLVHTESEF